MVSAYDGMEHVSVDAASPLPDVNAAREYGYAAAGLLPDIYARISRSVGPLPPKLATTWWEKVQESFGGDPVLRGLGLLVRAPLSDLAQRLRDCALEFRAKGAARVFAHGATLWGGSGDAEAKRVDWVWADSDSKHGYGDWLELRRVLDECGIAYVASRSGGHTPEKPKWHIHFPLAQPLYPPAPHPLADPSAESGPAREAWLAHEADVSAWKAGYSDQYLWFFGVLARIAGLRVDGFDEKIANQRIFQPSYPASRRHEHAAVAEVICHEGNALDWHAMLAATGYTPTSNATRRRSRASIDVDPETATAWHAAFAHDDLVIKELGPGKYALKCPWEHLHSPGKNESGTVLFPNGNFHCSHGHWNKDRDSNRDVLPMLSPGARAYVDTASESVGVRDLRRQLREREASNKAERVSLQELAVRIRAIAVAHRPGTTDVVIAPPGSGKNRALNKYIPDHPSKAVVVVAPNHELAKQHHTDIQLGVLGDIEHRRGVLSCNDENDMPLCTQYERASKIQAAGADVSTVVCRECPDRSGCPAIKEAGKNRDSTIIVTVPQLISTARKSAADRAGIQPGDVLVVHDESVKLFETVQVTHDELWQTVVTLDADAKLPKAEQRFHEYKLEPLRAIARVLLQQRGGTLRLDVACELAPCSLMQLSRPGRPWLPNALDRAVSQYAVEPIGFTSGLAENSRVVWDVNPDHLAVVLRTVHALDALAHSLDREGVGAVEWVDKVLRVRAMTDAAKDLEAFGGIVTDATPKEYELVILTRNHPVTFHRFEVPDGAKISRTVIYRKATSRGALLGRGIAWDVVLSLFREAITRAKTAGCKKVLFVTYKRLVEGINAAVDQGAIAVRQLLDGAGFECKLAWYGAVRGLNTWRDCDGCATIGDHWENIEVVKSDLRAAYRIVGLEPDDNDVEDAQRITAESEPLQAHERLRGPSRQAPAWYWHIGSVIPAQWTESNATVDGAALRGRPKTQNGMTQAEVRALVDAAGGPEAAARLYKKSPASIYRYLDGRRLWTKEAP